MENDHENDDLHPIARRGFERLCPGRHRRADGAVLVARITLDAIAEKPFGNGKH